MVFRVPRVNLWGAAFLIVSVLVLVVSLVVRGRRARRARVPLARTSRLRSELARTAEEGGDVHIALGTGSVTGDEAMSSVAALRIASGAADLAVSYGLSPTIHVGDPTLLPVAQDGLRRTYERHGIASRYDPAQVRFVAPGPIPFAAGAGDAIASERAAFIVIAGSHGAEITLVADPGVRQGLVQYVAVDSAQGSASSFAATDWLAPGEALFAAAAAASDDAQWHASLAAQDVVRWVLVAAILLASAWALLGG